MAFAENWNLVPVKGRFMEIDADAVNGYISFVPSPSRMIDAKALATIVKSEYRVYLDAEGKFSVKLPATDDPDVTPIDFTYEVTEHFPGGLTYHINVPLIYADFGVDISALEQVATNPGIPQNITREEFDALAMQVEMLLGVVYGGSATTQYWGPGLDAGGVDGV